MNDYKEFQMSWLMLGIGVPMHLFLVFGYFNQIGSQPLTPYPFIFMNLTFILIYSSFFGMTTRINHEMLTVSFGVGIIRRRIKLSRIKTLSTANTPWYYGVGIRFIPGGMLYSIQGTKGVELKFNDSDKFIRVGSNDPRQLIEAINQRNGRVQ